MTRLGSNSASAGVNWVNFEPADQIRTVTKERLEDYIATLSPRDLLAVERAIRKQLGLP